MRDLDEIVLWRDSRKDPDWPLRTLSNVISQSSKVMRIMEGAPMAEPDVKAKARGDHIIRLVSALETFFRDVVALLGQDANFLGRLAELKGRHLKPTLAEYVDLQKKNLPLAELIAADQMFQNVATINTVMSALLGSKRFLSDVQDFDMPVLVGGKGVRKLSWPDDWEARFENLFVMRHRLVHNSHWECSVQFDELLELEESVCQLAHVAWWLVAAQTEYLLMMGGTDSEPGPFPALWSVEYELTAQLQLGLRENLPASNRAQRRAQAARERRSAPKSSAHQNSQQPSRPRPSNTQPSAVGGLREHFIMDKWSFLVPAEAKADHHGDSSPSEA